MCPFLFVWWFTLRALWLTCMSGKAVRTGGVVRVATQPLYLLTFLVPDQVDHFLPFGPFLAFIWI